MADPYIETNHTGAGWGNFYGGTGDSAGVDTSAYFLYGAPSGYEDYQNANSNYGSLAGKQAAAQQLEQLLGNDQGYQWLKDHSSERDQLAETLGFDKEELYREVNMRGFTDIRKKITAEKEMLAPQVEEAKAARDTAKGQMDDPFQKEVDRQMGLATDYRQQATDAQAREGIQMDRTDFDADRARELEARQGMVSTEGTLRDWVAGTGPSAAQNQFQSSLDQSVNNQLGLANSARGGAAALASARNQAAQQGMQQRMQGVAQAGALRAQEMQSAMGQLQQQGYNMRAQDQTRSAQGAQWADAQARMSDAQRARNDLMSQYYGNQAGNYENMRQNTYGRQAGMNQARDAARQQDVWAQRSFRKGMEEDQYNRDMFMTKAIMGAAQGAMQAGAGVAGAALTGGASLAAPAVAAATNFAGGGNAMPAPGTMYGGGKGGAVSDY